MNAQLAENGLDVRRKGRITGSRIAGILGLSPYNKRSDVLREMVREHFGANPEFVGNIATEHGKENETKCLDFYEKEKGGMTYENQEFIIHPKYDFLAVTIDGRFEDGLVECKCPFRSKYTEMPAHYMPQVQLQMACANVEWCDFVCWRGDDTNFIQRIKRDEHFIDTVMPDLEAFMSEFNELIADKKKAAPYLQDKNRDDVDWAKAANVYRLAHQQAELAKDALEIAKQSLLDLSANQSSKGCGVQVIKSERKGAIKYADAIKALLPDADLSKWTGISTVVFTVKLG